MTRDEALAAASDCLRPGGQFELAGPLIAYAAELRMGDSSPLIDRLFSTAKNALPPENPATRLTLHDVEARFCWAHKDDDAPARIAIRNRRAPTQWWMHADDQSVCN